MDDNWKKSKYPDHNIKEIMCVNKAEGEDTLAVPNK